MWSSLSPPNKIPSEAMENSVLEGHYRQKRSSINELAILVSRMQKNADQVEKDILETQSKLKQDISNYQKNKAFEFQQENAKNLKEAETLLKDLFLDVDKAKRLKHPQAIEIEKDIKQLHDRVTHQCAEYRDLYEKCNIPEGGSKLDWAKILDQKQKQVTAGQYGPTMPELEKQIAEHNILQKEIEAYGLQIKNLHSPNAADLKSQYKDLLKASIWRGQSLGSLYNHLQGCTKELGYLKDQQNKILKQDWSDQMADPAGVRREYENFKANELLNQEEYVNQLQDDGDRMIELKHPAVEPIQAHQEALRNEWQNFLNLCICQESQLKSVESYKKFQEDADTVSQTLKKLNSDLDTKYSKFNKDSPGVVSDLLHQLENEEKTVKQAEKSIAELKRKSPEISPLKLRRTCPSQPLALDTVCDWASGDVQLSQGEKYTLKDNSNLENWVVQSSTGVTKTAPAACFFIPPPDPEAIGRATKLEGELNTVKQKRATVQNSLKNSQKEQVKSSQQAPIRSPAVAQDDPQADQLLSKLNKIGRDLVQVEKEIFSRVRSPVSHSAPTEDLQKRIKDQEGTTKKLQGIGADKEALQKECEAFLSKKSTSTTASQLPVTLNNVKNKYNDVKMLSSLYDEKAKASLNLENQIEITDEIISSFESKLAQDSTIPASPNALQDRANELQRLKRDQVAQQDCVLTLNRSLKDAEHSCSAVQNNFQEYCPDLPRQKQEVQLLNDRYHAVADQLDHREKTLQNTNLTYQQFQNSNENMMFWMNNLPKHQVKTTDGPSQINYKLQAQKRLVEEIQGKEAEKNAMVKLSQTVQSALNDYELQAGKYCSSLDPTLSASAAKRLRVTPLQESIQAQENEVTKLYTEIAAENKQQLSWLEFAKKVVEKKQVKEEMQAEHEQMQQSENLAQSTRESKALKLQLEEERSKVAKVQQELEEHRNRLLLLKTQRPIERVEEKEVVEYYRDPKLESNLAKMTHQIKDESRKRDSLQADIEMMNKKLIQMEKERKVVEAQLLTKEVTKIERDPNLDNQAASLRAEIKHLREQSSTASSELERLRKELYILEQKQPNIREKVVVKELIKLEKDPEMLKAVRTLQMEIDKETFNRKSVEDMTIKLNSRIEELERLIEVAEPKIIVKEVKKVEQDPELLKESSKLRTLIEEEKNKNLLLTGELAELQRKYIIAERQKPKVEVKERVNEIFVVDPETEKEITRLKKELQEVTSKRTKIDKEVEEALSELNILRSQKPTVEYKEVIQEVVKLEKSPEILREIDRLKEQLNELVNTNGRSQEQLIRLQGERDEWKRERSKVETKLVNKEIVRYENDPLLEKEADRLRQEVRNVSQKRRAAEGTIYDLQNKYMLLERRKPEEKVVVQEVILTQKDPKLRDEHNRLSRSLDEEVSNRRRVEREVQQLRSVVEEKEKLLNFQEDRNKRLALEKELRQITMRIKEIEESPAPVQEKIIMEEVVKLEKDPELEQAASGLRLELENEKMQVLNLQRECKNLQIQIDILQKTKSQEKIIYKEVIRVEKDRVLENERARIWELLSRERTARQNAEEDIRRLKEKIERAEGMKRTWSREEADLQKARNLAIQERANLESELRELERQKQQKVLVLREESKLLSQKTENDRQKKMQREQELSFLEAAILREKDQIYEKERSIRELQSGVNREEMSHETKMRETNLSTKISILDPETGKDMSPYEAYKRGIIDRNQYIQLQELECDWEEITTLGPNGDVSVLLDRKSGKQYSIEDALRFRKITKEEYQLYRDGKMPISEFALLVAGESKPPSSLSIGSIISKSPLPSPTMQQQTQSFFPPSLQKSFCDDSFPIAGVFDTVTDTKCNIRTAVIKKMVDPMTAQKLLEAQAATGGIVDLITRDRYSVHKAIDRGLIDNTYMQRLLNAQKAFTGVEDPVTKRRLSVGEAVQKGWMTKDSAFPYLQVQHLTGGLIDPKKTGRISVLEAAQTGMISDDLAKMLQDEPNYEKDLVDPVTKEKINYKEAMTRCQKDPLSGLLLLPATSEGFQSRRPERYSPMLSRFRH
ncbi:envoplakin isoform X1 [Chelonoidis abingdonii]|uniref:envoplakin isoform X1 n=1 Tax=Chelonoidis abingdonii TaxID=106734 RepID=UPI0013F28C90|nr:envoplakin isoform X1 [Chelonoidis abingdonii]XP_032648756.1 envoplakin isoform X1 [Chelonoidis abingdonii]XP_032648757.1 envoplakin isoform X1 [Chelonoidis abingdonii]